MTAIFYPDCEVGSESGRYTLEARSPHNGTIHHRDGRITADDEFGFKYRQHQSDFRYRLLDNEAREQGEASDSGVVWERFQEAREDSPHELLVSDDGWSVIRTHGFAPELIAVGPDGQDVLRIRLVSADGEDDEDDRPPKPPGPVWALAHLDFTTAGLYWSANSWRGFFRHEGGPYFAWRAWWGQRLVLDLRRAAAYTDERLLPPGVAEAVLEAECEGVRALLGGLSRRMDEVRAILGRREENEIDERGPLLDRVGQASSALHLVGVHRLRDCIPFLREWEGPDLPSASMGSSAMTGRWWLQTQQFRPVVHNAMKQLGEEPQGFPTYGFIAGDFASPERYPMPAHLSDRASRAAGVGREMSAEEVLGLIGSPDFIRQKSRKVGSLYEWSEDWEYDFRHGAGWTTLRITWEKERKQGRITAIEEIAPYWLDSDEREAEFLPF